MYKISRQHKTELIIANVYIVARVIDCIRINPSNDSNLTRR